MAQICPDSVTNFINSSGPDHGKFSLENHEDSAKVKSIRGKLNVPANVSKQRNRRIPVGRDSASVEFGRSVQYVRGDH